MSHLLAGDIGGTKTALYLYARTPDGTYREVVSARYVSAEHSGLLPIVHDFMRTSSARAGVETLRAAAFGIAGPVDAGVCKTTNLPWVVDAQHLTGSLGAPVGLINDFQAVGLGIGELPESDFEVLQPGVREPTEPIAILGAGTGLGEVIVLPSTPHPRVIASEGGHVDFAPRTDLEVDLLRFLWGRHRRVSIERLVSGPGIKALYDFVVFAKLAPESETIRARLENEDASRVIGEEAIARTDVACEKAVDLFVSLYGSEAGNLALKVLPRGGLFVAGGIAPKLIAKLRDGSFMRAFFDKGRLSSVLQNLHVAVVMNPLVGVLGARSLAQRLAEEARAV